jgi:hypothetical protein
MTSVSTPGRLREDVCFVRVFIEGVLCQWVESISISEGSGGVMGQISLPSSHKLRPEEWIGFKVHIFYANRRVLSQFGQDPGSKTLSGWPILFQGEIASISENRTVASKTVSFGLVSASRYLQQTQLYFYDPERDKDLDSYQQAAFLGNTQLRFETSGVMSKTARTTEALKQGISLAQGDDERFIGYLATIRTLIEDAASSHGSFRLFSNQLQLARRFGAFADPDVQSVLTLEQWASLVDKRVQALDNYVSVQRVLEVCTEAMRYSWINISQPKLSRPERPANKEVLDVADDAFIQDAYRKIARELSSRVKDIAASPDANLARTATVVTNIGSFVVSAEVLLLLANQAAGLTLLDEKAFVAKVRQTLSRGQTLSDAIQNTLEERVLPLIQVEEASAKSEADKKTQERLSASKAASAESPLKDEILLSQRIVGQQTMLHEWVVVPNMELTQPPRCNVITPDRLESYSMQIDFFREITRMYASARFVEKAKEWYIAPSTGVFYLVDANNNVELLAEAFDRLAPSDQQTVGTFDINQGLDEGDES